jgi:putative Mg2+ transporter-C (MgtC) family protein
MVSDIDLLIRLGGALVLGGLIGIERQIAGRAAGFRTMSIVSAGAALIMLLSLYVFEQMKAQGAVSDPSRIAAQVVSGIGFLGAGVIIRSGISIVGITTAATLWVCAAIGLAVGAGYYKGAVITTVLVIIVLFVFRRFEKFLNKKINKKHGESNHNNE